ncbi:MAG: pseudouridine-5'-phosphate glycosidase [Vicinamibacterales bacterium]
MSGWLQISDTVAAALGEQRPVVALETTLVTHGFPRPDGVCIAHELEAAILEHGAIPATIGVLGGRVRVGLAPAELEQLASAEPPAAKINLSNLAFHLARRSPGSTTVAATMLVAHRAGIRVFATGGIGGVHRGASDSGDVSADLTALSRVPVAVVCAGAKAILDLPKTVEMLETLGVPVLGDGTDDFPAFYRRTSGLRVDGRCDDAASLAQAARAHFALGTGSGLLVVNPIAAEHELAADSYDRALGQAVGEAARAGARGRDVTPFLLDRMRALTGGESVVANRALLLSNARVAADLAVALTRS